jgi:hypothetical protein
MDLFFLQELPGAFVAPWPEAPQMPLEPPDQSIGKLPADMFSSECTWRQTLSWTRSIRFAEQRRKFSQSGWKFMQG